MSNPPNSPLPRFAKSDPPSQLSSVTSASTLLKRSAFAVVFRSGSRVLSGTPYDELRRVVAATSPVFTKAMLARHR